MRLEASPQRRKLATLVFCDICGSTALAERLEPEVLRSVLTRWYSEMRAALERGRRGREVRRGRRDGRLRGAGGPRGRRAAGACGRRSGMLERQSLLSAQLGRQLGEELQIRIGVNSGRGAGVGDRRRARHGRRGQRRRPARAGRRPGRGAARRDHPPARRPGHRGRAASDRSSFAARGHAIEAHRLVRVLASHEAPAGEPASALVGRDKPLGVLEEHVQAVTAAGRAAVAIVTGPAGIGKTRIAQELLARVAGMAGGLHIRCEPGEGTAALAGLARALVGAAGESEEARTLAARLAVGEPAPPAEARWAVQQLLEAVARDRPQVAVLDDLQRAADPARPGRRRRPARRAAGAGLPGPRRRGRPAAGGGRGAVARPAGGDRVRRAARPAALGDGRGRGPAPPAARRRGRQPAVRRGARGDGRERRRRSPSRRRSARCSAPGSTGCRPRTGWRSTPPRSRARRSPRRPSRLSPGPMLPPGSGRSRPPA